MQFMQFFNFSVNSSRLMGIKDEPECESAMFT